MGNNNKENDPVQNAAENKEVDSEKKFGSRQRRYLVSDNTGGPS